MAGEIFTSIHNNYRHRIPAGVSVLVEQPLYIIVATWAMRTNTLLTTEEVSREFLLTQQRATDIIHYIHNEGFKHITSERITLIKNTPKRTRYRALKIINVTPLPKQLLQNIRSTFTDMTFRVKPESLILTIFFLGLIP
ncbi:CaiF/GrlA family transcriptional regulator [Escherichia coli]|uniref:CaiF/GrlA family transcriptional regulator n=1 Tax=Escherichia coli TaxID=562 RepID=UPI000CDE7B88|nr:CaiF/GrlA family transcriptional regulator [Escherichia coli]MBV4602676.1 CaiF/GrlA family transcriptional regulator [Escherichia coli]MCQ1862884.1 CaiF/GrlA family transcriptional regulator [Escherichia coli]NUC26223.1 CaiF/GrlA family transcriptional regulator [Escherichia coli]POZ04708.1 hypothetical protein C3419_26340 [Escherichia coli]